MTAIESPRQPDAGSALPREEDDAPFDLADRSTDALRAENERLAQRVADLEMTVVEYRAQMSQVLMSASWRLTSPLRALASRYRMVKAKARRRVRRLRKRQAHPRAVLTAGLFTPDAGALPEFSPLRRGFDPNGLARPPLADGPVRRPPGQPRVLVVAHVHYPELWGDIEDRLSRMPEPYDLIVTVTEGAAEAVTADVLRRHPRARIDVVPNRGRDWASIVGLANEGALSGYDAVAKVHTKKSEHRIDGDGWRLALLDGIFESPEAISRTIDLLREDRSVGLVVPTGHVAGTEHWGSDQVIVETLASRLPMAFDPDALTFPSGSMFWCRPWLLERLADLCLTTADFEPEAGQYDGTTAHALERLVGIFAQCGALDVVEAMDVHARLKRAQREPAPKVTTLAFYLPQYHRIPENDEFWGAGFTDWVNVRKARPLMYGHRQPILPADDVGFYDLSDPAVLHRQAATSRQYGLDGFVFHHYWFDGRQVLDAPLRNWLADPALDMPLALCWANEPWTRRWDGLERDVLIPQAFTEGWEARYAQDVAPYMRDPRYIRVDGSPLLLIYRIDLLPEPIASLKRLKAEAAHAGFCSLHLLAVQPARDFGDMPDGLGEVVDGFVTFPPGSGLAIERVPLPEGTPASVRRDQFLSYETAARELTELPQGSAVWHRSLFPGWDNSARRGPQGYGFLGANPVSFRGWMQRTKHDAQPRGETLLFVNAWNEWAEGAALEPGMRFGESFLGSTQDCFRESEATPDRCGA
ncbi:MAG: glycoside hydrolase family 99-like domain-containing protein [Candidatus Nanopelagicales bacterium]